MRNSGIIWLLVGVANALILCEQVNPAPTGSICGQKGYYNRTHLDARYRFKSTLDNCALLLKNGYTVYQEDGTQSLSYQNDTSECILYYRTTKGNHFVSTPDSAVSFWDDECFDCKYHCKNGDPPSTNVVLNGNFEFSNKSVYPFAGNGQIVPGNSSAGSVYKCANGDCAITQPIYICPDQQYMLTFDFLFEGSSNTSSVSSDVADLSFGVGQDSTTPSNTWRTYQASFLHDAEFPVHMNEFGLTFISYDEQNPTILAKNVQAQPVPTPFAAKPGAKNLLQNPGFETGSFSPWKLETNVKNYSKIISPGLQSKYAFSFRPPHSLNEDTYGRVLQKVKTEPGKTYLLTFSFLSDNDSVDFITTSAQISGETTYAEWSLFVPGPVQANGWHKFERVVKVTDSEVTVQVQFEDQYHVEFGVLDDVVMIEADL